MNTRRWVVPLLGLLAWGGHAVADAAPAVAGLTPFERPAGAPVISSFAPSEAWKQRAVRGIDEPQNGLKFLNDQGAWYSPFLQPNLPGRYDIRQMHRSAVKD
jgi:hypothetical protein